jgi:hypothetical protein
MCQAPTPGRYGRMGSTIMPIPRRLPAVAPRLGNRLWSPQRPWTGRRCVPNGAPRIRNNVPPAVNSWCAPASSRVEVPRRLPWRGSALHETDTRQAVGRGLAGRGAPGVCPVAAGAHLRGGAGTLQGRGTPAPWPQTRRLMGDIGWMPACSSGITSIACMSEKTCAGRIGGRAVQLGVEADTWPSGVRGAGVARWRPGAA